MLVCLDFAVFAVGYSKMGQRFLVLATVKFIYLSELRRDFLASVGITYAVFQIAKSRLRAFSEFC